MTTLTNTFSLQASASASAPGKLIIFGEHAVVYGQPAIAAAISDLRIKADVRTHNENNSLNIHLPDLKPDPLSAEIPLSSLKVKKIVDLMPNKHSGNCTHSDESSTQILDMRSSLATIGPPTKNDVEAIQSVLDNVVSSFPLTEVHKNALLPVVYLINILLISRTNFECGLTISAKSQNLPLGAGLGSSAAFSVAMSAALYKVAISLDSNMHRCNDENDEEQCLKRLKTENDSLSQPSKDHLDVINTLAFYSETLIHGTPSGIDNTVSTYGGALQYTKTKYSECTDAKKKNDEQNNETIFLHNFPPLNVILTNTKVPRSTKHLVRGVRELKQEHPEIVNPILDSIGNISVSFRKILSEASSNCKLSQNFMEKISRLIQMNHYLLCALGVSHSSLNAISDLTTTLYGELKCSTKLTGAGGGGCAFTFLENENDENDQSVHRRCQIVKEKIDSLECGKITKPCSEQNGNMQKEDSLCSFESFTSAIGGNGVMWV